MKNYNIVWVPDPVLKQTAQPIENINDDIRTQAKGMLAAMHEAHGIGLAANQVGELNRIFVMDLDPESWAYEGEEKNGVLRIGSAYRSGEKEEPAEPKSFAQIFINPEIVWESEQRSGFEEGCLSLPRQFADVERPAKIRVKYLDENGRAQEEEAEGLNSHAIQHEIDHLNGVLFVDYLSSLKRNMLVRKVEKMKKQQQTL